MDGSEISSATKKMKDELFYNEKSG